MMRCIDKVVLSDKIIMCLYAFSVIFSMTPSINTISLYVFVPIMGLLLLVKNPNIYVGYKYILLYFLLVSWMSFTAIVAIDTAVAWRHMIRIISAFIFSVISYYLASKPSFIKWLYIIIVIRFLAIYYRASSSGELVIAEHLKDRHQFEDVNANMIAYFLYYASFAVFMLLKFYGRVRWYIFVCASLLLLAFSVYISLITASRQVLIIQIPLLVFLLLVMFFKLSVKNIILLGIPLLLMFVLGLPLLEGLFSDSLLAARFMESFTEDSRFELIRIAISEGVNHPLVGIGPNNFALKYGLFTHTTYMELLVSSGFPAMIIYIYIVVRFIYLQVKRYRRTGDRTFLMFFVYACTFFVDNIFYVFVGNMWLMGLFFIVVGHSEQYYKSYIYEIKRCRIFD